MTAGTGAPARSTGGAGTGERVPARGRAAEAGPTAGPTAGPVAVLVAVLVAVAVGVSPLLAAEPTLGLLGAAGLLAVLLAAARPASATVLLVFVTPLLVGLERGTLVPGLRLNEVLLAPVAAGLFLALLHRWYRAGGRMPTVLHRLDLAVLAVAVTASVTILLWMYARGRAISTEDVLYSLALWKLVALYAMVRVTGDDPRAARALLLAVVATGSVVGVVGVLQALGVGPVIELLRRVSDPGESGFALDGGRATSTVGNPHGYGDLLLYAAVAAAALARHRRGRRWPLWGAAAGLAVASLASGSVSTLLALVTAGIAFAVVTRTGRWLALAAAVLAPLVLVALQPVLAARMSRLDPDTGLPASWTDRYGRWDNLQRYFWPTLGEDWNWVLGVRPASRVPGEVREWVYIESGWTWAVWNGGLLLLAAVVALLAVTLAVGRRLRRSGTTELAAAVGVTLSVLPWVLGVLLFLDPHLTLRGGAEVLFVVLALGATLDGGTRSRRPAPVATAVPPGEPA